MSEKASSKNGSYSELRTYDWNPELGLYTRAHQIEIPPDQGIILSRGKHPEITIKGLFLKTHDARKQKSQLKIGAYHSSKLRAVSVFPEEGDMIAYAVGEEEDKYPANGTHEVKFGSRELIFVGIGLDKETALKRIGDWEEMIPLQRGRTK